MDLIVVQFNAVKLISKKGELSFFLPARKYHPWIIQWYPSRVAPTELWRHPIFNGSNTHISTKLYRYRSISFLLDGLYSS